MKVTINGHPVDVTLDTEKTVGDVLSSLETLCSSNGAAIIGVALDGQGVPPEQIAAMSDRDAGTAQNLAVTTVTGDDLRDALAEMTPRFQALCGELEMLAVHLHSGAQGDALRIIQGTADTISDFCAISRFADLFPERFGRVKDFFVEIAPLLKDFCEAIQNNDTVLTGDLAEYEIKPRIVSIAQILAEL
ncbi:MAG: hypothetical protein LBS64_05145 [Spirochaetaceae bacterium]|jgi:hypothetical protein|nr:hypothetical protein [Spirochaetaceae bacterium]